MGRRSDEGTVDEPLSAEEVQLLDAYWRAANYLSVGQIYLLANPLLREPLRPEHIKPRLLGHFGTTPGLNLIYAGHYATESLGVQALAANLSNRFDLPWEFHDHPTGL